MALRSDLPDRPMAAVFADTGFEPRRVYEHLHWLIQTLGSDLPVHIVRAMRPDGTPSHYAKTRRRSCVARPRASPTRPSSCEYR
jgi:hypothetical protein